MIYLLDCLNRVVPARCRMCCHLIRDDSYMHGSIFSRCSTKVDKYGYKVGIVGVNKNAFACQKFEPTEGFKLYLNQLQTNLKF